MDRLAIASASAFVACVAGSIYAAMMLGCYAHEVLGHGSTAAVLGGTFRGFHVGPDAHGGTWYDGVPHGLGWIPLWGGIFINLVFGLSAVCASHLGRFSSGHAMLALLAVGTTHTGQALGYSVQGALSGHGDAWSLHDLAVWQRAAVVVLLIAGYILTIDWGIRTIVALLDRQFAPESARARRRWFLGTVLVPLGVMAALRPGLTVFSPAVNWASGAAVVAIVGAWGFWRAGGRLPAVSSRRPFGGRGAAAWLLVAGSLAALATVWSSSGVVFHIE